MLVRVVVVALIRTSTAMEVLPVGHSTGYGVGYQAFCGGSACRRHPECWGEVGDPANLAPDERGPTAWFTHADERTLPLAHPSCIDFLDQTLRPDSAPHPKSTDSVPRRKHP
jgi:hypothetical protein